MKAPAETAPIPGGRRLAGPSGQRTHMKWAPAAALRRITSYRAADQRRPEWAYAGTAALSSKDLLSEVARSRLIGFAHAM